MPILEFDSYLKLRLKGRNSIVPCACFGITNPVYAFLKFTVAVPTFGNSSYQFRLNDPNPSMPTFWNSLPRKSTYPNPSMPPWNSLPRKSNLIDKYWLKSWL